MSKTITFTTKITFTNCENLTVQDVEDSITQTKGIYLHLLDKTVDASVELIEIVEAE